MYVDVCTFGMFYFKNTLYSEWATVYVITSFAYCRFQYFYFTLPSVDCKMFVSREMFIQRDMINVYLHLHISTFVALNVLHEIEFYFVSLKFLY